MKIFLSSLENGENTLILERGGMLYNLMSFYYVKGNIGLAEEIRDKSELIMIDSGAHSFQKGVKVDWLDYTRKYGEFIQSFDRENVLGYFEMDVDNIIGYEKVLELRKILENISDKIIPVWHKNRGIEEFKKMCHDYSGKIVAITGFRNEDIKDEQYMMFLKYARKCSCKVHCLGMTRQEILKKVPFDYTDSATWKFKGLHGMVGGRKVAKDFSKKHRDKVFFATYLEGMAQQRYYENFWRKYDK